jgi:hypothetical protein
MGNIFTKIKVYFFENKNTDYAYDKSYKRLDFFDIDETPPVEYITYHPLVKVANN